MNYAKPRCGTLANTEEPAQPRHKRQPLNACESPNRPLFCSVAAVYDRRMICRL